MAYYIIDNKGNILRCILSKDIDEVFELCDKRTVEALEDKTYSYT